MQVPPNKALVVKFADRAQGPKAPPASIPLPLGTPSMGTPLLPLTLPGQALNPLHAELPPQSLTGQPNPAFYQS